MDNILKIKKYNNLKSYLAIALAHNLFCKRTFETKNINLTFKRDKNFTLNADLNTFDVYNPVNLKSLSK